MKKDKNVKKIILVAIAIAVIASIVMVVWAGTQSGLLSTLGWGDTCTVTFNTTPTGCTVIFEDEEKTSPCSFYVDTSTAGTYYYGVEKAGYTTQTGSVYIPAHATLKTVTVTLVPNQVLYTLTIITNPLACSVACNGESKNSGTTGAVFTLPAGTYQVTISKTGYTSQTVSYTIASSTTKTVTLSQTQPTYYTLTVITNPLNCLVTANEETKNSGTSGAVFSLQTGTYPVTVFKEGYEQQTVTYTITGSATKTVTLVQSSPPEGEGFTVEISVINQETYAGIEGVQVLFATFTDTTDSQGIASFYGIPPGTYPAIASKTGFDSKSITVTVISQDVSSNIYLLPPEEEPPSGGGTTFSLTVEVYDDGTNLPLSGISVLINTDTLTTDSQGKATITVSPGIYQVSLTKTGYTGKNSEITITDSNKVVSFYLVKISTGGNEPVEPAKGIPGFEAFAFVIAFSISFVVVAWRRGRKQ